MQCTLVNDVNEMNYGLNEMNEMDYGLKQIKMKCHQELDNKIREELRLIDYSMS